MDVKNMSVEVTSSFVARFADTLWEGTTKLHALWCRSSGFSVLLEFRGMDDSIESLWERNSIRCVRNTWRAICRDGSVR